MYQQNGHFALASKYNNHALRSNVEALCYSITIISSHESENCQLRATHLSPSAGFFYQNCYQFEDVGTSTPSSIRSDIIAIVASARLSASICDRDKQLIWL